MRRLLLGFTLLFSTAYATVHYKLTPQPASKSILVSITVDDPRSAETFHIPAWCPGYYQIATYDEKVFDVHAADPSGRPLQVDKVDARGWKVRTGGASRAIFSYKVLGDDPGLGFFAVKVSEDKTFINGAAGFMYVDGRKGEDIELRVQNPDGWDIATAMDSKADGTLKAGGYDELIDHPIQLGVFQRKTFKLHDVQFEVIFVSPKNKPNCDMDAEADRLRRLSEPALKMFGGASFKRYLYILHLEVGSFSGGLEHRACNVQAVSNGTQLHLDDLAAHEYFHAWNVKQIRPMILGPFDYTQPQRTANLWFAEGVTDYYSKLHTFQSGVQSEGWLKSQLLAQIQELQSGRTRRTKTVEDASKGCWESDGFGVGDLSFYVKGLLSGFILDAAIINATNGHKTLDDVMRLLYLQHELPKPGYGEDDLRVAINDVAGTDLSTLYNKLIRTTDELPYGVLSKIGLRVTLADDSQSESRGTTNHGPAATKGAGFSLDLDPGATPHAKGLFQVWLHRQNTIE